MTLSSDVILVGQAEEVEGTPREMWIGLGNVVLDGSGTYWVVLSPLCPRFGHPLNSAATDCHGYGSWVARVDLDLLLDLQRYEHTEPRL